MRRERARALMEANAPLYRELLDRLAARRMQRDIADALDVTEGRVSQLLAEARQAQDAGVI